MLTFENEECAIDKDTGEEISIVTFKNDKYFYLDHNGMMIDMFLRREVARACLKKYVDYINKKISERS